MHRREEEKIQQLPALESSRRSPPPPADAASLHGPESSRGSSPFTDARSCCCSPTRLASVRRPRASLKRSVMRASADPQEGVARGLLDGGTCPTPTCPLTQAPFLESAPQKSLSLSSMKFVKLVTLTSSSGSRTWRQSAWST